MDGEFRHFRPQEAVDGGQAAQNCTEKLRGRLGAEKRKAPAISATVSKKNTSAIWTLFFYLYEKDPDFKHGLRRARALPASFGGALQQRGYQTVGEGKETFFPEIFEIMQKNMEPMSADVDWLIEKFDYQNKGRRLEKFQKMPYSAGMQNIGAVTRPIRFIK